MYTAEFLVLLISLTPSARECTEMGTVHVLKNASYFLGALDINILDAPVH